MWLGGADVGDEKIVSPKFENKREMISGGKCCVIVKTAIPFLQYLTVLSLLQSISEGFPETFIMEVKHGNSIS